MQPTKHNEIMVANEKGSNWNVIKDSLIELEKAILYDDYNKIN